PRVDLDMAMQDIGTRCLISFTDPATTAIYPLSLHDALPICPRAVTSGFVTTRAYTRRSAEIAPVRGSQTLAVSPSAAVPKRQISDRKSTRLNSSHVKISYAVFCLKKKIKKNSINDFSNKEYI